MGCGGCGLHTHFAGPPLGMLLLLLLLPLPLLLLLLPLPLLLLLLLLRLPLLYLLRELPKPLHGEAIQDALPCCRAYAAICCSLPCASGLDVHAVRQRSCAQLGACCRVKEAGSVAK